MLARLPPTLVSLRARFNKLSQMSGLPASLVELDLSSNLIDSTRGLATCTRLQRLRLAHNRIRRVEQVCTSSRRAAPRIAAHGEVLRSRSSSR